MYKVGRNCFIASMVDLFQGTKNPRLTKTLNESCDAGLFTQKATLSKEIMTNDNATATLLKAMYENVKTAALNDVRMKETSVNCEFQCHTSLEQNTWHENSCDKFL